MDIKYFILTINIQHIQQFIRILLNTVMIKITILKKFTSQLKLNIHNVHFSRKFIIKFN